MAKYSTSAGVRYIVGNDGRAWRPVDGAWVSQPTSDSPEYVLEKRRRSKVEGGDTGWYLYDDQPGGFFGEWCGSRILDAVDEADRQIG